MELFFLEREQMISNRFEQLKKEGRLKTIFNQEKKFTNNVNYNLKLYRLCYHYSQKDMARILGITPISYRRKENRTHGQQFTESEIRIIHKLLNIPYSEFFQFISKEKAEEMYDLRPLNRRDDEI